MLDKTDTTNCAACVAIVSASATIHHHTEEKLRFCVYHLTGTSLYNIIDIIKQNENCNDTNYYTQLTIN